MIDLDRNTKMLNDSPILIDKPCPQSPSPQIPKTRGLGLSLLDQVDSEIKNMGKSYMIRKKVINHPKLLELRVANYIKNMG